MGAPKRAKRDEWVLADPHAGLFPQADEALLALLDRAIERAPDLLVMGDLFLAWLGPDRFWTPLQREVMQRLERLSQQGARVRFVVGNRDYLVPQSPRLRALFEAIYEDEALIEVGGQPTLVLHGDGLNPQDWPYLLWRRLSRSGPATAALLRLPGVLGRGLATAVERRMSSMNPQYKRGPLPQAPFAALSRRAEHKGARRALVGHFHADAQILGPGAPVWIAPGWFEHRKVLVAGPDGALRSTDASLL